jgi:hypothetical protein
MLVVCLNECVCVSFLLLCDVTSRSPMAAPKAGGSSSGGGANNRAPQRSAKQQDDEDDFGDTDVTSLLV